MSRMHGPPQHYVSCHRCHKLSTLSSNANSEVNADIVNTTNVSNLSLHLVRNPTFGATDSQWFSSAPCISRQHLALNSSSLHPSSLSILLQCQKLEKNQPPASESSIPRSWVRRLPNSSSKRNSPLSMSTSKESGQSFAVLEYKKDYTTRLSERVDSLFLI
jgi:hypothetical protein